jgi:uncharacterized protein YjbJ (UPF0337 family)
MNKINMNAILLAISFGYSVSAMAQGMSRDEYKAEEKNIKAEYSSAKDQCGSLAGNAKDICKGKKKVAEAELDARYKPSKKADYEVSVAKAEAEYAVADEKCDDKGGNDKDVCVKEAKAARVHAKSDAKALWKSGEAKSTAREDSADARQKAKEKSSEARHDATADKRDADYAVAKEKCDALSGDANDRCVNEAKTRYGK